VINRTRLIKLTQKVIQYNSVNPPGNERALAKFIEKDMRSLKLDVKTYTFAKNRPNIVAALRGTWPRKKAAAHAILLTPHFDTVPIGTGWKYNPLGGEIHAGKIYGRGASDDKGNLTACMEVMRSLVEDDVRLKRDVIMAATVDEETGSDYGIIPLLEKKIIKCKDAVIMDSTEFDAIIAQKGLLHIRVQIFGKKAHGAYNWRGESAIEKAGEVIHRIKQYKFRYKRHALLHGPTMNVGTIQGGDKVNMVADFCEFSLDTRFMPTMTSQQVLKIINGLISGVTKKYKIIIDDLQQPYELDWNHPCVKTYVKIARTMGTKAGFKGSEGATVITFFKKHGIPAFATGCGSTGTAHTTDEYITIKNLVKGTQILEQFLKEYDAS
jgi:succinyl-diaminopimelate desuccinylase